MKDLNTSSATDVIANHSLSLRDASLEELQLLTNLT